MSVRSVPRRSLVAAASASLLCVLLASCGSDDGARSGRNACGGTQETTREGAVASKAYFVATNYTDSTVVCSYDFATGGLREEKVNQPDSNDVVVLRSPAGDSVLVVERFTGKAAKPSRGSLLGGSKGAVIAETGALPRNFHDALALGKELLAIGRDRAETMKVPLGLLGTPAKKAGSVAGAGEPGTDPASQFVAVFHSEGRAFVLSDGYDMAGGRGPVGAKIHRLDTSLSKVDATFDVKTAAGDVACDNAAGVVKITSDLAVLSCNPQYAAKAQGTTVSAMHVRFEGGAPVFRALASGPVDSVGAYDVRGVTKERDHVLVEERVRSANGVGAVKSRTFLPLSEGGTPRKAVGVGGAFVYNASTDRYLFSCAAEASGACKAKAFVSLRAGDLFTTRGRIAVEAPTLNGISDFERPVLSAGAK